MIRNHNLTKKYQYTGKIYKIQGIIDTLILDHRHEESRRHTCRA